MFTGIIQDVGRISGLEKIAQDVRLRVDVDRLSLAHCRIGDSIAVSGVCLTVTALRPAGFSADVSHETLSLTTIGSWSNGVRVNLEMALRVGDAIGGHLVCGHIDGMGVVEKLESDGRSQRVDVRVPQALARYVARKGSIAIDGVSLTVNEVEAAIFGVNIIPHTQSATTFDELRPGRCVNIEVDQLARYVERVLGKD